MPLLNELEYPKILDASSADLIKDFFEPVLAVSEKYDRGVGYFSAGWLRLAAKGMTAFASNNGVARWVTSPILDKDDWEALLKGEEARNDERIKEIIEINIHELEKTLEKETLSALAWLVADRILEFKLAVPRNKLENGEFHDKFGIFTDASSNQVSFNGSYNDSIKGNLNYESIKIFCSWEEPFSQLVMSDSMRFERLWNNLDPNVLVYNLPEAARLRIVNLRHYNRPYDYNSEKSSSIELHKSSITLLDSPEIPSNIKLREYQIEAIDSWFSNECRGIMEMATGTGKTITALSALVEKINQKRRMKIIICCPYKHLVEQWKNESEKFRFRPISVAESRKKWEGRLIKNLRLYDEKMIDLVTIICTNRAMSSGVIADYMKNSWEDTLIVIDEVHHYGAKQHLKSLPNFAPWRLGLTATPKRYFDDEGTHKILEYFGGITFSFPLEKAIGEYLTKYYYYPILVHMTDSEFDEFCKLTKQIAVNFNSEIEEQNEKAERLMIKRSRILNNTESKLDWVDKNIEDYSNMNFTLFYVGDKLFHKLTTLLGYQKGIKIHEFTEKQSIKERSEILSRFSTKDLQALVAMKCLDEGVDVPPTRVAYFLASSGNPKEFIQRRGRVLRKFEGKEYAYIYDLISVPPTHFLDDPGSSEESQSVKAALRREYRRVKEFANLSENKYQALDKMFSLISKFDLMDN